MDKSACLFRLVVSRFFVVCGFVTLRTRLGSGYGLESMHVTAFIFTLTLYHYSFQKYTAWRTDKHWILCGFILNLCQMMVTYRIRFESSFPVYFQDKQVNWTRQEWEAALLVAAGPNPRPPSVVQSADPLSVHMSSEIHHGRIAPNIDGDMHMFPVLCVWFLVGV
jgi:hypothetical protein